MDNGNAGRFAKGSQGEFVAKVKQAKMCLEHVRSHGWSVERAIFEARMGYFCGAKALAAAIIGEGC